MEPETMEIVGTQSKGVYTLPTYYRGWSVSIDVVILLIEYSV